MSAIFVSGIAIAAPGLNDWQLAMPVLRGERAYEPTPLGPLAPALLPANERRRMTTTIKLAVQVAQDALPAQDAVDELHCVFVSGMGDCDITDKVCRALAQPERPVSPTHFHNSVHNAPAGYFAIATRSQAPSLSIAADQASFAAGLLEAATQVAAEKAAVLLVAYDTLPPEPIRAKSGLTADFGTALLLTPQPLVSARHRLELELESGAEPDRLTDPALEQLRLSNPMARSLPLLAALAGDRGGRVRLPYLDDLTVRIELQPC